MRILYDFVCRELIALHKDLEKKAFAAQRKLEINSEDEELVERLRMLEQEILVKKKQLHNTSEDLTLMVSTLLAVFFLL